MDNFSKEGRKLRPRKSADAAGAANSEKVEFNHGEQRPYGEHRNFGDRKPSFGGRKPSFGGGKPYGERRSFGPAKPFDGGERQEGEGRKPYGERRSFGDRKPSFGGRKPSFGDGKPYGERRSFGPAKPFDGERQEGEGHKTYGERRSFGDRKPSFGGRKPSFGGGRPSAGAPRRKNNYAFNERSEEGVNRMIGRRPLVENTAEPAEIQVPVFKEEVRLNKFIANSGVCSRREADTLIQAGVVTVNGEVVTELGVKVNITKDDIRFNGQRLKGEEKVYIILNKPKGFVTTASDPHAEKTIMDLVKGCTSRVYPVGRLDKNTTGVLMLTNDGEMAERLSHPAYDKKKIYQVSLDKNLDQADFDAILSGITLEDGPICADSLEYIDESDHRKMGIEIHSGKNRIVRRIFEHLGYNVKALDRVYFAGLTKKGLKKGEWRYLSESEVNILRMGAYM